MLFESRLKPSDTQLNGVVSIITSVSKNFTLYLTLGSFVGEESSVSIVS